MSQIFQRISELSFVAGNVLEIPPSVRDSLDSHVDYYARLVFDSSYSMLRIYGGSRRKRSYKLQKQVDGNKVCSLTLPSHILESFGIEDFVMIIGHKSDYLEIWRREDFLAYDNSNQHDLREKV